MLNNKSKILIPAVAISIFSIILLFGVRAEPNDVYEGPVRAVIIDQLHDSIPNEYFQKMATQYLEAAGYTVDLYTTKDITVDFYKRLPSTGYSFIVIRSHSVASEQVNSVSIFTGEKYQTDKYIMEQLSGHVLKGSPLVTYEVEAGSKDTWNRVNNTDAGSYYVIDGALQVSREEPYFLIGSKFVKEMMIGKFPDSIIIIGGCNSLSNTSLADALLQRGADAVIGWDETVSSGHNDAALLSTLRSLMVEKSSVSDAVQLTMKVYGPDPHYSSTLKYFPENAGKISVAVSIE
ncbi:MAG: hypothetical protein QXU32_04725 [Nitrososphaerales archaeon]